MAATKEGIVFLPQKALKKACEKTELENATSSMDGAQSEENISEVGEPPESALENSTSPINKIKINESVPEQVICTQKSENRRKYESILKDTENGICGEEIMRKYNFKRRKDLESFLYSASIVLGKPPIKINFETNFDEGEKPLHPLKIARDGSLRISAKQLKRRAKIDAQEGTEFIIKPLDIDDNEEGFKLIVIKK